METLVGAMVLVVCTAPLLGSVAYIRTCAADAAIDAGVANALNEQIALVRSLGRSVALVPGTVNATKNLGSGVTLAIVRTVAAVAGKPRLYRVGVVGSWTSRGEGGKGRTLVLETYVFAPDN